MLDLRSLQKPADLTEGLDSWSLLIRPKMCDGLMPGIYSLENPGVKTPTIIKRMASSGRRHVKMVTTSAIEENQSVLRDDFQANEL